MNGMELLANTDTGSNIEVAKASQTISENGFGDWELTKIKVPPKTWRITLADLQILSLLASIPMTGYALRKSLFSSFGTKISFGTLYPRLRYLEKLSVIRSTKINRFSGGWGIKYELTVKGKAELRTGLRSFQDSLSIIDELTRGPLVITVAGQ